MKQRAQKIYSRYFLGVTLVPFTNRRRKAASVCFSNGYYLAICGKGSDIIVISSDDIFKPYFDRNDFLQHQVARALLDLNAIPLGVYNDFSVEMKKRKTNEARKRMADKWAELSDLLDDFGVKMTKEQDEQINRYLNIEAL